jgi:glyoxylase-like metal-dependent hydrolase (beta-lactamase superfamily II)
VTGLLPPQIRVIERGWLSSNNILCHEGETATLVDSGYVAHAEQTVALVREALAGRRLARLINTHSHSDHIGGNAALQRTFGCDIVIPVGIEAAVAAWDEQALLLTPSGQRGDRFRHDATLAPGEEFEMGGMTWRALAAPGHDMEALIFHCPEEKLLISGDALWRDGFGIIFAEVMGLGEGLKATRGTLEMIGRLAIDIVIPGHGAPFDDVDAALERAHRRVAAFAEDPGRMARNAIKACFTFNLLELQSLSRADLPGYLESIPFFHDVATRILAMEIGAAAEWLVADLLRAGAIEIRDDLILPTMAP